jgi:secreted trypsin-like serine protease
MWLSVVLGLALGPVAAQEPIPYAYDTIPGGDLRVAPRDKPADQLAAEQFAADAAEAACNSGSIAGCAALGRAFMHGEGRPQNRPVAELLLRQACDGAEAEGCLTLGLLLRSTKEPDILAAGTQMLGRGCRLGNLDACAEEADAVDAGTNLGDGDRVAANALRRTSCEGGSGAACRALGSALVGSDDPATRAEGLRLLERQCRAGDGLACGRMTEPLRRESPPRAALAQEMVELGCRAGLPYMCSELGELLFEQGSGPPETRTAALVAFDRACALESMFCSTAQSIRSRPALDGSCRRGVQADCMALGRLYASENSLLFSPAEAVVLLGNACETGLAEGCRPAMEALLQGGRPASQEQADQVLRWLDLGCTGGENGDCDTLGKLLLAGEDLPPDPARGYAALALACERGRLDTCATLDRYAMADPDAPLLVADARFGPPLSAEEEAEIDRQEREAEEAAEARRCRTSEVAFRGAVYADTVCELAVVAITGGRLALAGEAPWQALLWRPAQMNQRALTANERVECGGALIREGWILTAAHCVIDAKRRPLLTSGHQFRLGVLDAREPDGISYGIRRVFAHPRYHEASRTFDIALVELETRRRLRVGTPHLVRSILFEGTTISQRMPQAGAPVYVFGWGRTAFGGNTSTRLKAAKLALEDAAQCESRNRLSGFLQGSILCAKAADRSQACDGDSGGPLVSYDGRPTVIGVVSAGVECGRTGVATRYTRVAKVLDWIDGVLAGREAPIAPR